MKIGVVGAGMVGATAAYAMTLRGSCTEIVLYDRDPKRAKAEAQDIAHAAPLGHGTRVTSGGFASFKGSDLVIVTAGAPQEPGESRLDLVQKNAVIFRDLIPKITAAAPEATLLIVSNPVDILTSLTVKLAPGHTVLGSGTVLDSARFRHLLAQRAGVDATHVHGYVLGEHGDSEVVAWSTASIAGVAIDRFMRERKRPWTAQLRREIEVETRDAAANIIAGKRATYYGIGAAIAQIAERILGDRRAVLTVSAPTPEYGVSLSLPRVVGQRGVLDTVMPQLSAAEQKALNASARVLREVMESL